MVDRDSKKDAPARQKRTFLGIAGKVWGGLGGILGAAAAALAIWQGVHHAGTPTFTGELQTQAGAHRFLVFVDRHDGDTVRLDARCLYTGTSATSNVQPWCANLLDNPGIAASPGSQVTTVMLNGSGCALGDNSTCPDSTDAVFLVNSSLSDAEVDNGSFGAGNMVFSGEFEVSKRGGSGAAPANVTTIYLLRGTSSQ